ncbi:E3 ubiquitin-protein ligase RNF14 [Oryzias melastigma]|uniref:E3 ubiquitin-protein ligase RNF14 n=1 Tax=Oryzias melastigma TaxID=30732 RepID=UPI000CF82302|nr:E3 ubiquitin-protein ligase RNF14 [Oryzias melastigma]
MNTDLEEQEDELIALQSIYYESEEFVRKESKSAGEIRVSVELPADFTVVLKHDGTLRKYQISFLPPLLLTFELPEDYPSSSPPSFTLTCSWLTRTQLDSLSVQLVDLYQATGGAVVLFSWIQFLKEDALKFLDIHSVFEVPSDEDSSLCNKSKQEAEVSESKIDSDTLDLGSTTNQQQNGSDLCGSDLFEASGDSQQNPSISQGSNPDSQGASSLGSDKNDKNYLTSDPISEPELLSDPNPDKVPEDVLNEGKASGLAVPSLSSSEQQAPTQQEQHIPATDSPANKPQLYANLSLTSSQILLSQILIHNASQKRKVFGTTVFDCGICFSAWLGSECVQLHGCGHVFCQACLREFCKVQITEGNIQGVTCPQAGCPATPTPAQVKTLVGEELFNHYDRLLLQFTLDRMPDLIYCPRPSCSSAILLENSSTVALCPGCHFAFCVTCKKTYHGASKCYEEKVIQKEQIATPELSLPESEEGAKALLEDYHSGSKERRRLLEKRYGYASWVMLEETVNEKWKNCNTQPCPHCYCAIEKNGGCPHMLCTQCNHSFIWRRI